MSLLSFFKRWFTIQEPTRVKPLAKVVKTPRAIALPRGVNSWVVKMVKMGKDNGWKPIDWQGNLGMLSMWKDDMRLNIYTTTMTVGTCLNHPKKGKTQLFRKNVSMDELEEIYKNPRVHTNKGYHKKGNHGA